MINLGMRKRDANIGNHKITTWFSQEAGRFWFFALYGGKHMKHILFIVLALSLALISCRSANQKSWDEAIGPGTPTLIATIEGQPIYTPVAIFPADTALPSKVIHVTIDELVKHPQRYADKFIAVTGVYRGEILMPMSECWVMPPWQ